MTIDRYTKVLLTIIAACLLFQTVLALDKIAEGRQAGSPQAGAIAQQQVLPVVIVGWDTPSIARLPPLPVMVRTDRPVPVTIDQDRAVPVAINGPLKLTYTHDAPLPVSIDGIRKGPVWDSINAHVDPQEMGNTPGPVRH